MKLESLKSSKFEAFKDDILLNAVNVIGGQQYRTGDPIGSDCWDDATDKDIHEVGGQRRNWDVVAAHDGGEYEEVEYVHTTVGVVAIAAIP